MRILFLVKRFTPATGGVERYIDALSRAVLARGHRVSIVTGAHEPGLAREETLDGRNVYRFPAYRSPLRCCAVLGGLRHVFEQADVVHVSDVEMLDYFWRMMGWRVSPKRLFLTQHGMSCVHPVPTHEQRRSYRARKLVDGVVHDGAFIGRWLNVDPNVIAPQGLLPIARDIPLQPEPPTHSAIYVGRLEPDTGVELYFDALVALRKHWQLELPLDVCGDGSLRDALELRAKAQKLRVNFRGSLPDAAQHIVEHSLAFVSGRMAIHEALARRRAVVAAFNNPIRADYVRSETFSPFIASGGNGRELAEHVRRLLADDAERRVIAEQGWEHVADLTWDRTAETYLNLWTSCAPAPTRPTRWRHRARLAWRIWREAGRRPAITRDVAIAEPQAAPVAEVLVGSNA